MRFKDRTIGILAAPGFDDFQVFCLASKLKDRGAGVSIIGVGKEAALAVYGKSGSLLKPDASLADINSAGLDAVIIPSKESQDDLIDNDGVMTLVMSINAEDKPVAVIGNAVTVLAAAGLLEGRRVAAVPGCQDKLEERGTSPVKQDLVVDRNIITARSEEAIGHFVDVIAFLLEPAPSFS